MSTIRAQTKTTSDFKHLAVWHEVTMVEEYTRTVKILAVDKTEAGEIAGNRAKVARSLSNLGYIFGDIEIIEVKTL